MSEGKANAQAGHAYVDALLNSLTSEDALSRMRAASYAGLKPGTKICLDGGSLSRIEMLCERLAEAGTPHVRIVDSGHVEAPDFDGRPILTAIGIGPLRRDETPNFLRKLPLWTGGARLRAQCAQTEFQLPKSTPAIRSQEGETR